MNSSGETDGVDMLSDSADSSPNNMSTRSAKSIHDGHFKHLCEALHAEERFITKREKIAQSGCSTPAVNRVPSAPVKAVASASRIFPKKRTVGPQSLSFREPPSLESPHYSPAIDKSYFDQLYHDKVLLGSGSFGTAFKVKCKDDEKEYAIKRTHHQMAGQRTRMLREVEKLEQIPPHPNIVKFICAWEEKDFLYIKMELCRESLTQYLWKNHDIEESIIWQFFGDLLFGLRHLHNLELVHMDIKPDNIFIDFKNVCKIGDLGLVVKNDRNISKLAEEGDSRYLACEVVTEDIVTKAADIYSLGMTMLELSSDLYIPTNGGVWSLLNKNKFPEQFLARSVEMQLVIVWMMFHDYCDRPQVEEILEHPELCEIFRGREKDYNFPHRIQPRPGTPPLKLLAQRGSFAWRKSMSDSSDMQNVSSATESRAADEVDGLIPTCKTVLTKPLLPQEPDLDEFVTSDSLRRLHTSFASEALSSSTPYRQRKIRRVLGRLNAHPRASLNFDLPPEPKRDPSPVLIEQQPTPPLASIDESQDEDKICVPRNLLSMFDDADEGNADDDDSSMFLGGARASHDSTSDVSKEGGNKVFKVPGDDSSVSSSAVEHKKNGVVASADFDSAQDMNLDELNISGEKEHKRKRARHSDTFDEAWSS